MKSLKIKSNPKIDNFTIEVNLRLSEMSHAIASNFNIEFANDEDDLKKEFFLCRYKEPIDRSIINYIHQHLFFRRVSPFFDSELRSHAVILREAITQAMEPQIVEISKMSIEDIKKLNLVEKLKQ